MKESDVRKIFMSRLKDMFPKAITLKNDANQMQGIPDWTILIDGKWLMIEFKKSRDASFRPNQEFYIRFLDELSFARVVFPENMEEVLNEIQQTFGT